MKKFLVVLVTFTLLFSAVPISKINAAQLTGASVSLSDSRPSTASVVYTFDMDNVTTGSAVMCFTVTFTPNADGSGTSLPSGMNITSAAVVTGSSDYIPNHGSFGGTVSNNVFTYKHASAGQTPASNTDRTLTVQGITNGNTAETAYYAVFKTFTDTNCTSLIDSVTVSYVFITGQVVTGNVDPSLSFALNAVNSSETVNGDTTTVTTTDGTIPFGAVTTAAAAIAAHDLVVGTNADGGYTVTIKYSGALASTNHNMASHGGSNASPSTFVAATEAFGYTTNDTSLSVTGDGANRFGSQEYAAFTTSPAEVAYNSGPTSSNQTTRVGYKLLIGSTTPAGSYTTTVIYSAVPTY